MTDRLEPPLRAAEANVNRTEWRWEDNQGWDGI